MSEGFDARKAQASAWFRSLRDDIVAAFEGLEDSQPAPDGSTGRPV
jgi:coproporphyrinogen III oxidase